MNKKITAQQLETIKREAHIELARRSFWEFCKLRAPDFYKENLHLFKKVV